MITITKARKSQLDELAQIYVDAYATAIISEPWDLKTAQSFMAYMYKRQPDMFIVACVDGKVAGGICAGIKPWWNGNHIYDAEVFVSTEFRSIGVAKQLFRKLVEEGIQKHQVTTMEFTTFDKETFLLSWYKRLGMKESEGLVYMWGEAQELLKNLG